MLSVKRSKQTISHLLSYTHENRDTFKRHHFVFCRSDDRRCDKSQCQMIEFDRCHRDSRKLREDEIFSC